MAIPARRKNPVAHPTAPTGHYRGEEGRRRAEEEAIRSKARAEARRASSNMPFRYRVGVGQTGSFVVLDDAPDFFRFEHTLKNPATGRFDLHIGCCAEWDNCPADATDDAYYALYLTVIDLTPYTNSRGEEVPFARKLLVVKPSQQKKIMRAYKRADEEYGSFRGVVFETTRDGDKDASIGNDIITTGEVIDEDTLQEYVRVWTDAENKEHTENCFEVLDYETLFPSMEADEIATLIGATVPGSRAYNDQELRGGRGASSRGAPAQARATPSRRAPARGSSEDEEEDAVDAPVRGRAAPPARGAARSAPVGKPPARSAPTTRVPSRRPAAPPQDEEPEEEWEEPAPRRTMASGTAGKRTAPAGRPAPTRQAPAPARSAPARRAARPPQEEEEDDDIPF